MQLGRAHAGNEALQGQVEDVLLFELTTEPLMWISDSSTVPPLSVT
jgi:hypothetical protein